MKSLRMVFGLLCLFCCISLSLATNVTITMGAESATDSEEKALEDEVVRGYEDVTETRTSKLEERGGITVKDLETKIKFKELRMTAENKEESGESVSIFGLRMTYASLFSQQESGLYDGFYRLVGKVDSDAMGRLNLTGGYHLFGGVSEMLLGYRLLFEKIRADLPINGDYDEHSMENALALRGTYYPEGFIRVVNIDVLISRLDAEIEHDVIVTDTPDFWSRVATRSGHGDLDTVSTTAGVAFGSDGLGSGFFQGARLDLDGGYEKVKQDGLTPFPDTELDGLIGTVRGTLVTSIGTWTGEYHDGQAADKALLEWRRGSLRIFWQDAKYSGGIDESLIGFSISGEFSELTDPLGFFKRLISPRPTRLFPEQRGGYNDIRDVGGFNRLENDQFIAKPRIAEGVDRSEAVFRTGLPSNTRLDTDSGTLIVRLPCEVDELSSVTPNSADESFSDNGSQVEVYLSTLPHQEQTIKVRAEQRCGGYTDIFVSTGANGEVVRVRTEETEEEEEQEQEEIGNETSSGGSGGKGPVTVIVYPIVP